MPGKRILLVDYDPRSLSHTREVLESAGFDVSTCSDGLSALDQYKNLSPDLVLLSAMLPKMHGFEVCSNIRKLPGGEKTPVVIITDVYKGKRYRVDAINKYGATEYIEKPIEDSGLVGILKKLADVVEKPIVGVHEDDDKTVQFSRDLLDQIVQEEVTGAIKTEQKTVSDKKTKDEIARRLEESLAGLDLDLGGRSKTRPKPAAKPAQPKPEPAPEQEAAAPPTAPPGEEGVTFTAEDLFTDVIASVERELQSEQIQEKPVQEVEDAAPTMAIPAPGPAEPVIEPPVEPVKETVEEPSAEARPEAEPPVAEPVPEKKDEVERPKEEPMTVAISAADLGLEKEPPRKPSVDKILDKKLSTTLSGLMKEGKAARPKPAPKKEPPKAAPTVMITRPEVKEPEAEKATAESVAPTVMEEAPIVAPPQEGINFGNYLLLGKIATGGMAELFKAKRKGVEGFEKILAIKRILPHMSDNEDFVTMFIDEAKLAAQLTHHNICQIFDLGKIDDSYYIAMEYVHGKDLRAVLKASRTKNRPMQIDLAVLVASRLCSALDYAHRKKGSNGKPLNLVHRDVSPQNVLISYEGEVKLVDFGIAKAATKAHVTQHGALKGKLLYMSPEQAWGKRVDKRTDIFSLGIVLYEMLTGKPLFFGENDTEVTILEKVREARVAPIREFNSRVSPELEKIVLKALKKNPDERYQSASEVQKELDHLFYSENYNATSASLAEYVRELFQEEWMREGDIKDQVATVEERMPAPQPSVGAEAEAAPSPILPEGSAEEVLEKEEPEKKKVREISMPEIIPQQESKGFPILPVGIGIAAIVGVLAFFMFRSQPDSTSTLTPTPAPTQQAVSQEPPASAEEVAAVPPDAAVEEQQAEEGSLTPEEQLAQQKAADAKAVEDEKSQAQLKAEEERKKEESRKKEELAKLQEEQKLAQEQIQPEPAPAPSQEESKAEAPPAEEAPGQQAQVATPPQPSPTPPAQQPEKAAPKEAPKPKSTVKEGDLVDLTPDVTKPELVKRKNPSYPPAALTRKIEGTVILSILVNEQGKVSDVKILREAGGGTGLNEAAVEAVKSWSFQPAVKEGKRVKVWVTYPIVFKLQN